LFEENSLGRFSLLSVLPELWSAFTRIWSPAYSVL